MKNMLVRGGGGGGVLPSVPLVREGEGGRQGVIWEFK